MAERALKDWINDQLHDVVGYSERTMTDFVLSLSKSAKSASSLLAKLHEADVPKTAATQRFAAELFSRRSGASSSSSGKDSSREQRKETLNLLKQNESYGFVDADGERMTTARRSQRPCRSSFRR